MKILKTILKILLVLVIIYLISAFLAKSSYKVERSVTIDAPQKLVYNHVGILRNWENWSPWKEKDPTAVNTYKGPDGRAGSIMQWVGDKHKTGSGQVDILVANPPYGMSYKLKFNGPPEMHSNGLFQLSEPSANKTLLTWSDAGDIPFILRPMMMFGSMDKFMGPDFERGLAKIQSLATTQFREATNVMKKDTI